MQQHDTATPEQAIEVPKLSLDKAQRRMGDYLRPPQTEEQLVEVPTIISYSSLLRTVEQTIDIPVPQVRGGGGGGLQGFRPGQGSPAADVEQIVDNPVPQRRRRRSGGLQSSLPGLGSTAYLEQIVGFPASSRFPGGTDEGIQGSFRTFSRPEKSAWLGPHSGSELGADFTPWTPAAYAKSGRLRRGGGVGGGGGDCGGGGGGACSSSSTSWDGQGRGCAHGDRCTFAHSWAELHPAASAHEQQLASHFPD